MSPKEKPGWSLASPLGGCGFAFACWTVGFAFTGINPVDVSIAPGLVMALMFAGLAQFVAGIIEFARGVHALGFCHGVYGIWGMGTAILFYTIFSGLVAAPSAGAFAVYWIGWAIVTLILAFVVIPVSKMFSGALWWLMVVFVLFAVGAWSPLITHIGGYLTMGLALYTWYIVAAFAINTAWEKTVVPVS